MPFDARRYHGGFSFGLLYLLDSAARAKFLEDCHGQLRRGGAMIFTVISKRLTSPARTAFLNVVCRTE